MYLSGIKGKAICYIDGEMKSVNDSVLIYYGKGSENLFFFVVTSTFAISD